MRSVVDRNVVMRRVTVFQVPAEVTLRPSIFRNVTLCGLLIGHRRSATIYWYNPERQEVLADSSMTQ